MWITIVPLCGGTFLEKKKKKMFDLNQINTLSSEIAMQSLKKRKGMLFGLCLLQL
jgi:hypothetical protein